MRQETTPINPGRLPQPINWVSPDSPDARESDPGFHLESLPELMKGSHQVNLPFRQPTPRKWRSVAGISVMAASSGWVSGFALLHRMPQAMPWCIALMFLAFFAGHWLFRKRNGSALYLFKLGELRPLVLSEGFAISFVIFSLALLACLWLDHVSPHPVRTLARQVVDIELVSNSDAVDRHDLLPGTKDKTDQEKKITGTAEATEQGRTLRQDTASPKQRVSAASKTALAALNESKHQQARAGTRAAVGIEPRTALLRARNKDFLPVSDKPELRCARNPVSQVPSIARQENFFLYAPARSLPGENQLAWESTQPGKAQSQFKVALNSKWATTAVRDPRIKISQSSRSVATLEEVAPPEMVEVTDSAGETQATELWQSGGRSSGGTGAKSNLAAYLKELHRKIKHAWTPPGGETRTAAILFRINRSGKLGFIKLDRSSGNSEMDDAAMVAVAGCAPFKALPSDFPSDYLDLLYTFNYTVDRLAEASKSVTE